MKLITLSLSLSPTAHPKKASNKKVLLLECKRHTARRVVSTPSVVLLGYPPPPNLTWPEGWHTLPGGTPPGYLPIRTWPGGYPARRGTLTGYPPILTWLGVPYPGTPQQGTPLAGYPLAGPGRVPTQQGMPLAGPDKVPPSVCPMEFWVMLQSIMGYGYPPVDMQMDGWTAACQNITFPLYYVRRAVMIPKW